MVLGLGLNAYVEFIGFVEHELVLARFLEYSAVLIPSLWEEPLSGTIAEAMARGLPVIATDRGRQPRDYFRLRKWVTRTTRRSFKTCLCH